MVNQKKIFWEVFCFVILMHFIVVNLFSIIWPKRHNAVQTSFIAIGGKFFSDYPQTVNPLDSFQRVIIVKDTSIFDYVNPGEKPRLTVILRQDKKNSDVSPRLFFEQKANEEKSLKNFIDVDDFSVEQYQPLRLNIK